jgi:hypothetical protein
MGTHFKDEMGAEGAGSMMKYEDTIETIEDQQRMGVSKIKGHPLPPGYRN